MERNLIGELSMYMEAGIRPNFSEIARRYGMDRHTVASWWEAGGERPPDGRSARGSAFDAYRAEIEEKAALPGVTKKGVHEWLLHRHPGAGLPGYNAFTHFLRSSGIAVGAAAAPEAHPRFETAPGQQLQFDWKEGLRMADRSGEVFEFNVFAATLCWSRRHLFLYSPTRTEDDLLRCMYLTVRAFGGVAREWVTDNMSAVVSFSGGRRVRSARVEAFARDAGFSLALCKPRSPQTKGKVESSNRFLSRLRAYEGDFDGVDGLREAIARVCERSNAEPNETTGAPPSELFMREKEALLPVGSMDALLAATGEVREVARVPPTMLVPAGGRKVSVPRRCIGRRVRVVSARGGGVDVYMGGELVASHAPGSSGYDPAHYLEAMEGKRWAGGSDIAAAAAANLELLSSVGGSL